VSETLKVIVLAAAPGAQVGGEYPRALQKLGDKAVVDHILDLARHFAAPQDIYVVLGYQHQEIVDYLRPIDYQYVLQEHPLGTGHAVLQVRPHLPGYTGDLLILYGDTPLFRLASMRGMLLRHRLKNADVTLFSCVTDYPLPYGRIVRDVQGQVLDIIEEADASESVRRIHELNLGAYAAHAQPLFDALQEQGRESVAGSYRLTEAIHHLVRRGCKVEAYRSTDQDEILGINTPKDLEAAALILQKRILRPRRLEEENIIRFGTGGWRAVIGEGFTLHNVRRLAQALANQLIRRNLEAQGALVGCDRRFLSDAAAEAAAEVFAGNNVRVALLKEAAPTPLITYATVAHHAAYGLAFTASHNPPQWNGLKVFKEDGALLLDDESQAIEAEANALSANEIVKIELPLALDAGAITYCDYTNEYVDAVESFVDMEAIRKAGLHIVVDPMFGVGELTINIILTEARCRVTIIHGRRDPLFGGRSPAPNLEALGLLIHYIKDEAHDLGLATDGDADRIAIIDERGQYIPVNDLLVVLYWYLYQARSEHGPVVRNLATTHMLDRLARHFGERCIEVPVGFKHIAAAMKESNAILGGESSGGLTIRGHILGKDGILAAALVVEMLAKTGRKVSHLLSEVYGLIGRLYGAELNLPATPEMKALFPRHLSQMPVSEIAGCPVRSISTLDGTKFVFDNDQWLLLRFSGTEPLLRIFCEADSPEKAQELLSAAQKLLPL
jgi:alpha-D-glucose phosphate-specific phosphoglucomutase